MKTLSELKKERAQLLEAEKKLSAELAEIEHQLKLLDVPIRDAEIQTWRDKTGINLHIGDRVLITPSLLKYKQSKPGTILADGLGREALLDYFDEDRQTFWLGYPLWKDGTPGGHTDDISVTLALEMRKAWLDAQKVATP